MLARCKPPVVLVHLDLDHVPGLYFDYVAMDSATCVLAVGFLITLWWARNSWIAWITVPLFTGLLAVSISRALCRGVF